MTPKARAAIMRAAGAGIDADILAGIGENQQCHQHVVFDRRTGERGVKRVGAEIADHLLTFLGDIRTRVHRDYGTIGLAVL